ncbi:metallophosphoesterase family protein [Stieleria varia]|uniref:Phosphodiesterase n=1 Tax=Stieleria varia TaxID=2528005 RepID=A0A5C6AXP0_9BACT|nr:metallophosphoesterase family protein [Stieleria varia]TWU04241.1 phosphodiesterase [Stieleria varia]
MKIGIISDIHGDLTSLNMALSHMQLASVQRVLCAGDLVERGSNDHGVIDYFRQHAIPCVQGNHDENAVRHHELQAHVEVQDDSTLSAASVDFLRGLPLTQSFVWVGSTMLLAHATPSDNGAPVFQDPSCEKLSKTFKKDLARMEADILVVGHTHYPFDIRYKGKRVLNPGSVCNLQSRDSHTCGILDLTDHSYTVFSLATGGECEILNREFT